MLSVDYRPERRSAADDKFECSAPNFNCQNYAGYPLGDFFNLGTPRTFMAITGATHKPDCFTLAHVYDSDCFPNYPSDPDDE